MQTHSSRFAARGPAAPAAPRSSQTPNELGGIRFTAYPCRSANAVCTGADPVDTIESLYDNGPLSEVSGWAKLSYQPNGMLANVEHGRIANDVWTATGNETWTADPQGMSRPRQITVTKGSTQHWTSSEYGFDGSGSITAIGSMKYAYDAFGRLARWSETTPSGGYANTTMAYDAFGNQSYTAVNGCGPMVNDQFRCYTTTIQPRTVTGTTNHYADSTYDAAGNVLADGRRTFTYDPLDMVTSTTVGTSSYRYVYDANDERIAAVELAGSGNRTTWTLRGFRNELLRVWTREADGTWTWKEDEIWRGTSLLGISTPQGRRHYALDHLGSPRAILDDDGNLLGTQSFEPFGSGGTTGSGALQFTGHERDRANLGAGTVDLPDYAHARFLDTGGGRFLSVDPGGFDPYHPQSWNRYAYVLNNPIGKIDPNRRDTWDVVNGAVNAFTHDISLGTAPRLDGNADIESGQQLGDLLALAVNSLEVSSGVTGTAGSFLLDATGVGAVVGVPAGVVSVAVATHGAVSGTVALAHLSQSVGGPMKGSSGGPGAGKNFSPATKDEARAQSGNRCVFCGTETTRKPGPNQSNIDHADPKSRDGNNALDNAQNTCRTCNLKKAVKTTLEFLEGLFK